MAKILINNTGSPLSISDTGQTIPASSQLTIVPQDFDLYAASNDVVTLVGNGSITVNNGSENLDSSDGIRLIQGGFSNRIQLNEDLVDSNRIKVDVTGTLGDGLVRVSENDSTSSFLENKVISADNKIQISTANEAGDEDLQIQLQPGNVNTSELNNDANFINSSQAPVQPLDIANFETSSQLDIRDTNNRNRSNHTGTQLSSTISDFANAVQSAETTTTLSFNSGTNILTFTNEDSTITNIDLSIYLDDTNLSRIISGTLDPGTGIVTFTRDDSTAFTVDFSSLNDQSFINAAINTHETTIDNHDDVDTSTVPPSNGNVLTYNGTTWAPQAPSGGDFKDFARIISGLINQTTTFQPYMSLVTNIPETGNYKIFWSYTWSYNNGSADFRARAQIDNTTTLFEHIQEPKDIAGTGINLPNTDGGTTNSGTNQRHLASGADVINLTAGAHTIEIDFACSNANEEAAIYRGLITIERWS